MAQALLSTLERLFFEEMAPEGGGMK